MTTRGQTAEGRGQSVRLVAVAAVAALLGAAPLDAQPNARCVPVAARALARGHVLTTDDIDGGTKGGSALCRLPSALLGSVTRRVIAPGEPLRAPSIAPPNVVEAGQPVAVVWREPGIEVRLKGVAANAAAAGERVVVRVDVRRRLEGVAVAPGLVQLQ